MSELLREECEAIKLELREIVHCKDCVNSSFDEFGGGWCIENSREVKLLDYCAWGEYK